MRLCKLVSQILNPMDVTFQPPNITLTDAWSEYLLRLEFQIDSLRSLPAMSIGIVIMIGVIILVIFCACSCLLMLASNNCVDWIYEQRLLRRDREPSELGSYEDQNGSIESNPENLSGDEIDEQVQGREPKKSRRVEFSGNTTSPLTK